MASPESKGEAPFSVLSPRPGTALIDDVQEASGSGYSHACSPRSQEFLSRTLQSGRVCVPPIRFGSALLGKFSRPVSKHRELAVLIACGSYSPPTYLHLMIFETARNYLMHEKDRLEIVGGIMSPVHDAYGKSSLVPGYHRVNMLRLATRDSDWIDVSPWEVEQSGWSRTACVMREYARIINEAKVYDRPVRPLMLCGTDVLETFLQPNLWNEEDQRFLLSKECGVVVIQRIGHDTQKLVDSHPLFRENKENIFVVPQRLTNTISSTAVRENIRERLSVKYMLPDPVIEYIKQHRLYGYQPPLHELPPADDYQHEQGRQQQQQQQQQSATARG